MEPLLHVRNCSFAYEEGEFELHSVSIDVQRGEMLGIVGPNGSGKSTLLRIMSGFLLPKVGTVQLGGRDLHRFGRRALARQVAFLPQNPGPSFELTVREVVEMGRYPHQGPFGFCTEADIAIIARSLSETDSQGLADRYFSTLSGGEQQRVLVASILAQQPGLMLLDEPTASLDIHHKSQLLDLLRALSRKQIGVVVVTHDLNAAGQFCDRLALLSGGRLVRTGSPQEVLCEDLLSEVYHAPLRVIEHPAAAAPMVIAPGKEAHEPG